MLKNISLKLKTRTQAEALFNYFDRFVVPVQPEDMAEALIKRLMVKVYKKLRNKIESYDSHGWSVTLTPKESMAYYIYWQNRAFDPGYPFEKLLVESHIAQIDQAYA